MGLLVGLGIALAVIFTASTPTASALDGFTLEDYVSGNFSASYFNGSWISDNEFSYWNTNRAGINIYNVETSTATVLVDAAQVTALKISSYSVSPDKRFVLYTFDRQPTFRHSSIVRYSILKLDNGTTYPLQPGNANPQVFLNYAAWMGNSLVYVYDNNVYLRRNPTTAGSDVKITQDGVPEVIYNGIPDWVYEEEVLGTDNAIWIGNGGKSAVFAKFDDTAVETMEFSYYGRPGNVEDQYPVTRNIRYPKAGRTNPLVSLWVVADITGTGQPVPRNLQPPTEVASWPEHYFTTVAWSKNDEVMVSWLNRQQNDSRISFCNVTTGACVNEQTITQSGGWVDDSYTPPEFSSTGQQYLMILPQGQGGTLGNFKHLVLYDRSTKTIRSLTSGKWEVTSIHGWDETAQVAYFTGTAEGKPSVRHLYSVTTASAGGAPTCISCGTVNVQGKLCTSNSVSFSHGLSYFVHNCVGCSGTLDVPRSVIRRTSSPGTEVFVAAENVNLQDRLSQKAQPRIVNMLVPLASGYNARVRLYLPPTLNKDGKAAKYPMLVYVYAGPHSQQITDRYVVDWGTHLASSKGVIYVLIDGRGSGFQGDKIMHEIYGRMGTVEAEDQIAVAKYLTQNLPYVDANQTAIWGWSYGGYATASVMTLDTENVFKCGMSVAPVTNWIYYDSIYTERFMGLPTAEDNLQGYDNGDVCKKADKFRGKKYYLIHGTADDNVHYQQSLMLTKSLEAADVLFRQQSYTDENHSIGSYRTHLYHSLTTFLMTDCFGIENEVWG